MLMSSKTREGDGLLGDAVCSLPDAVSFAFFGGFERFVGVGGASVVEVL